MLDHMDRVARPSQSPGQRGWLFSVWRWVRALWAGLEERAYRMLQRRLDSAEGFAAWMAYAFTLGSLLPGTSRLEEGLAELLPVAPWAWTAFAVAVSLGHLLARHTRRSTAPAWRGRACLLAAGFWSLIAVASAASGMWHSTCEHAVLVAISVVGYWASDRALYLPPLARTGREADSPRDPSRGPL